MPSKERPFEQKTCPRCGSEYTCSASAKCWCFEYSLSQEALEVIQDSYEGCVCPACLQQFSESEKAETKH